MGGSSIVTMRPTMTMLPRPGRRAGRRARCCGARGGAGDDVGLMAQPLARSRQRVRRRASAAETCRPPRATRMGQLAGSRRGAARGANRFNRGSRRRGEGGRRAAVDRSTRRTSSSRGRRRPRRRPRAGVSGAVGASHRTRTLPSTSTIQISSDLVRTWSICGSGRRSRESQRAELALVAVGDSAQWRRRT